MLHLLIIGNSAWLLTNKLSAFTFHLGRGRKKGRLEISINQLINFLLLLGRGLTKQPGPDFFKQCPGLDSVTSILYLLDIYLLDIYYLLLSIKCQNINEGTE